MFIGYVNVIVMCNEWEYSFTSFKTWSFANGYNDNLTIDRIDNNKGYSPENCRWVDKFVQANNKNNNIYYQFHGIKHTIGEWSRIIPINKKAVYRRLEKGNDVIDLFEKAYNMVYRATNLSLGESGGLTNVRLFR